MLGSRRHRPPKQPQPLTAATAHPNAAMAAAAVFKNRDQQTPSLSAAAAAAALRARPNTPTVVGEVQTKRTMRRTASVSSSGTAPDVQGRPGLQRRGSSASMTERTFRSPSPGPRRPGSSASDNNARSHSRDPPPPVPALPKNVDKMENSRHLKTQSLQLSSPPLRLASQTMGKEGSGSWFGAAQVGDLNNVRTSDAAMASPPLSPPPIITHPTDDERPDSRNSSINFSYPSRVRLGSPAPSPTATGGGYEPPQPVRPQNQAAQRASSGSSSARHRPASVGSVQSLVYDPNSRRMVPREVPTYEEPVGQTGRSLSVRKKKKQPAKTGTHLAQATMGRTKVAPDAAAYENTQHPPRAAAASPKPRQAEPVYQPQRHVRQPSSVMSEDSYDAVHHQPAPQPTETGRVPFATHAARNLVDPKPQTQQQQPQHHETEEEPAVKSLISAPRTEATKTEKQHPQEPVHDVPHPEVDSTGPEEFAWAGQGVRRQPSTVKEEPELEEEELHSPGGGHTVADALDAVPTRQKVYQAPAQQSQPQVAVAPTNTYSTPARQPASQERKASIQRERSVSSSPARTARFGGVMDSLTVRHAPPPRSVSPRKSALKISSTSPDRHGSVDDNASEASSSHRDDAATIARKKSARVSFNDSENVVVGESPGPDIGDSPIIASPQNARRPWYSNVGRSKKPEMASLDDDEIMKPRPVLPSFGSVRDKKPRDNASVNEERPLVRPANDTSASPSIPASPSSLPAIPHVSNELRTDSSLNAMTTGSDAVGSSQAESDRQAKTAANTSRFREPLPPVVTSIEGSGYVSDSSSSEDDQGLLATTEATDSKDDTAAPQPAAQQTSPAAVQQLDVAHNPNRLSQVSIASSDGDFHDAESVSEEEAKTAQVNIPTIAVSLPTPLPSETRHNVFFGVPGGFPEDDSEPATPNADPYSTSEHDPLPEITSNTTPVRQVTFEPVVQAGDAVQTPHTPATVIATSLAPVGEEDDDESSIYSDAPDHFTDTENEGFMSLDAIVERSLPTRAKKTEPEPVHSSSETSTPTQRAPQLGTELSTATTAVEPSQHGELAPLDWDKAKAYWRSLTADKRAQLEKEALSDVGDDADIEEDKDATPKPKKKKSIERRNSERKALAAHLAQQTIATQQAKQVEEDRQRAAEERQRAAERTYMIKPGIKAAHDHPAPQRVEEQRKLGAKSPDNASKLRSSMRTNGAASKPAHQEQPRQHALGNKTLRATSAGQAAPAPAAKTMRAPQRVSSPPVAAAAARNSFNPPPPIRRRGSDSSESSFRRFSSRPESGQGFGFRKTLRQPSPAQNDRAPRPAPIPGRPSGRFSLRSMSPPSPSSRAPMGGGGMSMRSSLRGSSIKETKSSGGGGLFGGKSSSKSTPRSKAGSSRFSDSSDDENVGPRTFRSRFDESSDEDDIRGPPPARLSMPKSMRGAAAAADPEKADWGKANRRFAPPPELSPLLPEEQEESDLEDGPHNLDEEKEAIRPPLPKPSNSRSGRGGFVSSPPATPLEKPKTSRRGSFMSVLRRKKNKTPGSGGIARPEVMDSAARRDTKLERSADELQAIRRSGDMDRDQESVVNEQQVRPRSPRLQKRTNSMTLDAVVVGGGQTTTTWPLASPSASERPATSGNLGTRTMGGSRPNLVGRRTGSENILGRTATGETGSVAGGTVVGGGGETGRKKKKFGALRKMFGLDD